MTTALIITAIAVAVYCVAMYGIVWLAVLIDENLKKSKRKRKWN